MRLGRVGLLAASMTALIGAHVMACDMVCVAEDRYESMLGRYKHVLVGRVEDHVDTTNGPEFRIKPIRVWKGKASTITLRNTSGMCGKTLAVGRAYVIFAASDRTDIDLCSPVMATSTKEGQVAITRLDRSRGLPPLSLPSEDRRPDANGVVYGAAFGVGFQTTRHPWTGAVQQPYANPCRRRRFRCPWTLRLTLVNR